MTTHSRGVRGGLAATLLHGPQFGVEILALEQERQHARQNAKVALGQQPSEEMYHSAHFWS